MKLGTSNLLINTELYECVHDVLLPKWMCSESREIFTFWEISYNISVKVQDRDIVDMEH